MAKSTQGGNEEATRTDGPTDAKAQLGVNHPLAKLAGSYKDDPFWDEFVKAMRDTRKAEDRHLTEEQPDVRP